MSNRPPLQNRVTPSGQLIAVRCRGTLMGNRGWLAARERSLPPRLHRRLAPLVGSGSDSAQLDVLVEAQAEIYGNQEHLIQLEKRLSFEVQSVLGITCNVKLVGPREIERSEGKAVRVVDRRKL